MKDRSRRLSPGHFRSRRFASLSQVPPPGLEPLEDRLAAGSLLGLSLLAEAGLTDVASLSVLPEGRRPQEEPNPGPSPRANPTTQQAPAQAGASVLSASPGPRSSPARSTFPTHVIDAAPGADLSFTPDFTPFTSA